MHVMPLSDMLMVNVSQYRSIFFATVDVGRSQEFCNRFEISHFLDLICTDDTDQTLLTPLLQQRAYDSMKLAVLDMASSPGNICVYCYNGRSRSASYVAAYFVAACGFSANGSYAHLSQVLRAERPLMCDERGIDRYHRFLNYVKGIECRKNTI